MIFLSTLSIQLYHVNVNLSCQHIYANRIFLDCLFKKANFKVAKGGIAVEKSSQQKISNKEEEK
jgi:hypothetical protein